MSQDNKETIASRAEREFVSFQNLLRKRPVFAIILVIVVAAPTIKVLYDNFLGIPRLKGEIESQKEKIAELNGELLPFRTAAVVKFGEPEDQALERLADELSSLEDRTFDLESTTADIALAPYFRPLDEHIVQQVVEQIKTVSASAIAEGIRVEVLCAPSGAGRHQLAQQLITYLQRGEVPVMDRPGTQTLIRVGGAPTIVIKGRTRHAQIANSLSEAFGIITDSPIPVELDDGSPRTQQTLAISIQGDPFFANDGKVVFR